MTKKIFISIGAIAVLLTIFGSCKKDTKRSEAEKLVAEWVGKEIIFPKDIPCTYLGKETVCPDIASPYKILVYTDSVGCTSCKLQLFRWNNFINEIASESPDKVSFHFYFQFRDERELKFLFKRDDFKQTIFLDREGKLDKTNKLPKEQGFQCFLLDEKNKVLMIGNPTQNPAIRELYKQTITGNSSNNGSSNKSLTVVEMENMELELKDLKLHQTSVATFTLLNAGDYSLVISDITASCGCTVPQWDKKPVRPGTKTEIEVKVTPDTPGHFRKVINVICNTEERNIRLIIKGTVKG